MINIVTLKHFRFYVRIQFVIVKEHFYGVADEQLLWKEIRSRIVGPVQVTISYVNKTSRTKWGKLRLVISDVK